MRVPAPFRPLLAFVVSAAFLLLLIAGSRLSRLRTVPAAVDLIPKENNVLLIVSSVRAAWTGIDAHFGPVIRDRSREGTLGGFFRDLDEGFKDEDLQIGSPADLARHGIDPDRELLCSFDNVDPDEDPQLLVAVPILDEAAFLEFLEQLTGITRSDETFVLKQGRTAVTVHDFSGDLFVAFPDAGQAVVASTRRQLERSLLNRDGNGRRFSEDDLLHQSLSGGWLQTAPEFTLHWQKGLFPVVGRGTTTIRLAGGSVVVDGRVYFSPGTLTLLEELTQPGSRTPWATLLPQDIAFGLYLEDRQLSRHVDLAQALEFLAATSESAYGGIVELVREVESLSRLSMAATGYDDGLPDLILGLWGDREELFDAVSQLRVRLKLERDEALIEEALAAWLDSGRRSDTPPSLVELTAEGFLAPEDPPLLNRHRITLDGLEMAELRPDDLTGQAGYSRREGDLELFFVLPPKTENDLRYFGEPAEVSPEIFLSDRFRLACAFIDDVLWVATDAGDLVERFERAGGRASLATTLPFRAVTRSWGPDQKLQLFLNVDRLIDLGLLSAESEVDDVLKGYLLDLENHPAVSLSLAGRGDVLSLRLELLGRTALEAR